MRTPIKTFWSLALLFSLAILSVRLVLAQSANTIFLPLVMSGGVGNPPPTATLVATQTATELATPTPTNSPTATSTRTATATASPTSTLVPTVPETATSTAPSTDTATVAPSNTPTPTNTATSTSTATPTPTNTATATSTSTPTTMPAALILANETWFVDISDNLHIVGQVENRGSINIEFVKVTANVFNASNQVIAVDFAFTMQRVLSPGQRGCYHVLMDEPANWTRYELEGTYFNGGVSAPSLVALNVTTGYDGTGVPEILGQVRNDGSGRAEFVRAIGTLFDVNNRVIGCDSAYVSSTDLNPGQTSSFRIGFFPHTYPPINSFSLQVHGDPE